MKIQWKRSPYGLVPADEASERLFNCLHLNDCIELDYEHVGERPATDPQKRSLHLWFRWVAECLNAHGIGMKALFAVREVDVPWTDVAVKEAIFRPVYSAVSGEKSTTMANTQHYPEAYKIISHKIAECTGVTLPEWPSRFGETSDRRAA